MSFENDSGEVPDVRAFGPDATKDPVLPLWGD